MDGKRHGLYWAIRFLDRLRLRRNLGHQRAICVGLAQFEGIGRYTSIDTCVVMDADGEDAPADVPRLLAAFAEGNGTHAVFASRLKRSEGLLFRFSYATYRLVHRVLTGLPVPVMAARDASRVAEAGASGDCERVDELVSDAFGLTSREFDAIRDYLDPTSPRASRVGAEDKAEAG